MKRWRKQGPAAFAALTLASWTVVPPAAAQSVPRRMLLGTLHVYESVEVERTGDAPREVGAATPLLEETRVRTGEGGAAYLDMGAEGGVGLCPEAEVRVERRTAEGLTVRLARGEIAFWIPARSRLRLVTTDARVQTPAAVEMAAGDGEPVQGCLRVEPGGETHLQVGHGSVAVQAEGEESLTTVPAGEGATIAAGEGVRTMRVRAAGREVASAVEKGKEEYERGEVCGCGRRGSPLWVLMAGIAGGTFSAFAVFDGSPRASR